MPSITHATSRPPSPCHRPSARRRDTAVSASISTPVWPPVLTVASIAMPGRAGSGVRSTATLVSGSGWQSGIRSAVRFARHDPGQPRHGQHVALLRPALGIRASVSARHHAPRRAPPRSGRSPACPTHRPYAHGPPRRNGQPARRITRPPCAVSGLARIARVAAVDIRLPHQAFADQEAARTVAGQVGQVGRRVQPAFGDDQPVLGHAARQRRGWCRARPRRCAGCGC